MGPYALAGAGARSAASRVGSPAPGGTSVDMRPVLGKWIWAMSFPTRFPKKLSAQKSSPPNKRAKVRPLARPVPGPARCARVCPPACSQLRSLPRARHCSFRTRAPGRTGRGRPALAWISISIEKGAIDALLRACWLAFTRAPLVPVSCCRTHRRPSCLPDAHHDCALPCHVCLSSSRLDSYEP